MPLAKKIFYYPLDDMCEFEQEVYINLRKRRLEEEPSASLLEEVKMESCKVLIEDKKMDPTKVLAQYCKVTKFSLSFSSLKGNV